MAKIKSTKIIVTSYLYYLGCLDFKVSFGTWDGTEGTCPMFGVPIYLGRAVLWNGVGWDALVPRLVCQFTWDTPSHGTDFSQFFVPPSPRNDLF